MNNQNLSRINGKSLFLLFIFLFFFMKSPLPAVAEEDLDDGCSQVTMVPGMQLCRDCGDYTITDGSDYGEVSGNHASCKTGVTIPPGASFTVSRTCTYSVSIPGLPIMELGDEKGAVTLNCSPCSYDSDCEQNNDDGDPCTLEKCDQGQCIHPEKCPSPLTCESSGSCVGDCTLSAMDAMQTSPDSSDYTGVVTFSTGVESPSTNITVSPSSPSGCSVNASTTSYTATCDNTSNGTCTFTLSADGSGIVGNGSSEPVTFSCQSSSITVDCGAECGDGKKEGDETCDDGNTSDCMEGTDQNGAIVNCSANCSSLQTFNTTSDGTSAGGCVRSCSQGQLGTDNNRNCSGSVSQTNPGVWKLSGNACYCNVCDDPELCS